MLIERVRRGASVLVAAVALLLPVALAGPARAHGWVTDPPSRQDACSTGTVGFDCGGISYEPQSVEAPGVDAVQRQQRGLRHSG